MMIKNHLRGFLLKQLKILIFNQFLIQNKLYNFLTIKSNKKMSKTFKMTIMTEIQWSNCSENSLVLTQKINTFDFDRDLNIGIVKRSINELNLEGKDVQREIYFESFNEDQSLPEFYNDLLLCLGMDFYFEITCSDSVLERLTNDQRENVGNAFYWAEENIY